MSVIQEIAVFLCGFIVMQSCSAQIVLPGACPSVQAMTDFEPARVNKEYNLYLIVCRKRTTPKSMSYNY